MRLRSLAIAVTPPVVVVLLWVGAVVIPTSGTAEDLQDRLDASDAELVQLAAVLDESRTAGSQLATMNRQLDELGVAVPATPDVAGFVRLVHTFAAETQTVVSSVTPQTEQPSTVSPGSEVTGVSVSLQGDYASIMAFLERLLTADRLVGIDSVDLAADSSMGSLFVELAVSVYSEPHALDRTADLVADADRQITDAAAGLTLEATN